MSREIKDSGVEWIGEIPEGWEVIPNKHLMKKNKEKNLKNKEQRKYDKGQIFVKVMAGILALLMILSVAATLIFSLI